jgi:hypothetical protein
MMDIYLSPAFTDADRFPIHENDGIGKCDKVVCEKQGELFLHALDSGEFFHTIKER